MEKVFLSLFIILVLAIALVTCVGDNTCKHDDPTQNVVCSAKEPTCQESGLTEGIKCNICGVMVVPQVTIEKLECTPGEWIIDKESTKTEDGLKHNNCTMCGNVVKEVVIYAGSVGLECRIRSYEDTYAIVGIGTCTDTEIVIPKYIDGYLVTKIDTGAFAGCTTITSIIIPADMGSIGTQWFEGCTALSSVTIPGDITDIYWNAFNGCTSLESLDFDGTVEQWNAVVKHSGWDVDTGDYTVYCTDGEITKDGIVTYYTAE